MREFIESIAGEKCLDFNYDGYDCLFTCQDYSTYCLFLFLTDTGQLLTLQQEAGEIFQAIKKSEIYDINMDKNITCVIFLCLENNEYYEMVLGENISDLGRTICFVEEDLNFFKKNVFLFTEAMRGFARENIGKLDLLCQEYFTEEHFQSYKRSPRGSYEYEFLINLFIKIPFLRFCRYQPGNYKEYKTMETYIEAKCRKKAIDHEHIEEICGQLEENIDDADKLYQWLDSLVDRQAEEERGLAKDED